MENKKKYNKEDKKKTKSKKLVKSILFIQPKINNLTHTTILRLSSRMRKAILRRGKREKPQSNSGRRYMQTYRNYGLKASQTTNENLWKFI